VTTRQYTIVLVPDFDEHTYTVTVPALPGVVAQAATVEEAISLARGAIELHLEGMMADGEAIPQEDLRPQAITLEAAVPEPEPATIPS
jgi:predicted RNase H-like HicB family nuclease